MASYEKSNLTTDFQRADQRMPDLGTLPPPNTWDYAPRVRASDGSFVCESDKDIALCTCSNRHTTRLTSFVHRVAADGSVSPSYVCPVKGCTFHVFVRLLDWDPNHVYEVEEVEER